MSERAIFKSSASGRIVSATYAGAHPDETYRTEIGREGALAEALRGVLEIVDRSDPEMHEWEFEACELARELLDED